MNDAWSLPKRHIYTISELTQNIKAFLEDAFPFVWVSGEISNVRQPVSGHLYFTLKDEKAQISAVIFRGHSRKLQFALEDGMAIIAMGRVNVFESRGIYQIIVEYVEPGGVGALQVAFEQLKTKLLSEGIFDQAHKKPLPLLPQTISVITSPTGAVIQDFLHVTQRRFPNMAVEVVPVKVQGEGSVKEIVNALALLSERQTADVVVLARGGGSLEDLQAFNSEEVARAIFSCPIPVVSAVGHETDYTIADLVADLRAPTPSAAAELVVPEKSFLLARKDAMLIGLARAILGRVGSLTDHVHNLSARVIHPRRKIVDWRLRIDDLLGRAQRACVGFLEHTKNRFHFAGISLVRQGPRATLNELGNHLERSQQRLGFAATNVVDSRKGAFQVVAGKLHALNPLGVLERGFSVTRSLPGLTVVKDVVQVRVGQQVAVKVAKGEMVCRVERKSATTSGAGGIR